jgi:hypothetical protein
MPIQYPKLKVVDLIDPRMKNITSHHHHRFLIIEEDSAVAM